MELFKIENQKFISKSFFNKKINFYNFENIDSTNKFVVDNIDRLENYSVVSAQTQNSGRGRLDRTWVSNIKGNIYASILLKDLSISSKISPVYSITQYTSIVIRDVLSEIIGHSHDLRIKWPNDIILNNKKVCGILSNAAFKNNNDLSLVIGFGINLVNDNENLSSIDQPATSILQETGLRLDNNELLEKIVKEFYNNYENFISNGFEVIKDRYEIHSYTLGKNITINTPNGEITGMAIGVDGNGFIKIESNNKINLVNTGDVVW